MITIKDVYLNDNWIHVDGIGRIGLYAPDKKAILLDYGMKMIIGNNNEIPCNKSEAVAKVVELFKDYKNL